MFSVCRYTMMPSVSFFLFLSFVSSLSPCQSCQGFVNYTGPSKYRLFVSLFCLNFIDLCSLLFPPSAFFEFNLLFFPQIFKMESQMINLRLFLLSNVCIQGYTFPYQHYFSCVPQILICCILISPQFYMLFRDFP